MTGEYKEGFPVLPLRIRVASNFRRVLARTGDLSNGITFYRESVSSHGWRGRCVGHSGKIINAHHVSPSLPSRRACVWKGLRPVGYLASVQTKLVIFTLLAHLPSVLQVYGVIKRQRARKRHPPCDAMRPGTTIKCRAKCSFVLKIIFLHQTLLT